MSYGLQWLKFVPLVALLWGWPVEVRAQLAGELVKQTVKPVLVRQATARKQNDGQQQDVLFRIEGELTADDAQLEDGSLHDVHLFEGEAGQIVRILLMSEAFDTFLILQDASQNELARNDDGSDDTNAEIVFRLPTSGQYRIIANAFDESGKGAYQLTVERSDENALRQAELRAELNAEAGRLFQQGIDSFQISQYREALDSWQTALEIYHDLGDRQGEATSLYNLGAAYQDLEDYPQAIDFYQQSLALARDLGNRQDEAISLNNLGAAYQSLGGYQQAIDFLQQSLALARDLSDRQGEANSLGNLGAAYQNLGDYPQAIDFYQQSLALARDLGNRQGEANLLNNLGNAYNSLGDYPQAIDFLQQSLALARDLGYRQGEANSLGNLGNAYDSLGDYPQAIDLHKQHLALAHDLGNRQGEADSLGSLGNAYQNLGEYKQAIDFYQQSLALAHDLGNRQGEANLLNNLGNAYNSLGDYPQAIDFLQQSLALARDLGYRQGEANSLGNLGNAYDSLGDYPQAIDFQQRSLAIERDLGNRQGEADSLNNLGTAYQNLGNYQQAIDFYQQYLAITRDLGDRKGEANALNNLGTAYQNLGDYQQAIDFMQQSLALARDLGDRQGEANSLGNLGLAYDSLGNYQQAIDFMQQSLAIERDLGDRQGEAASLNNLGNAYNNLGDYQQAIDFHQQSLAIKHDIGDRQGEAQSLGNLGFVYDSLGDYRQAIDFHQQSMAIKHDIGDRQGEANSLSGLGIAYQNLGDYQQAIDFHQQSLTLARDIGDRQVEADSLGGLGIAYHSLGDYQQAINFMQQSLALARDIGDRKGEANALGNLGLAWAAKNQPELAIVFYKDAVNIYETIRTDITDLSKELQASYTTSVEGTYRSLTDLLLSQGRILEAQQVLELLKVEELREFTRATYTTEGLQYDPIEQPVIDAHGSLIQLGANISACHPDCEQSLYNQQIALEGDFDQTVKTSEETIRTNRAEDDVFYDPNDFASDALDIVNAQDGTVLIYPVVLEDTLWLLWTATGGVVGSIEVPEANQAELSRAVVRFRELLTQKNTQSLEELKQVGQQLHSWLIEPLSAELEKNSIQHLVFAQDRATRYLPMAALYDGEQFLIENYTVSTVLSAALTDTTDRLGEVSTASTLGLGLDQSVSGFSSLPNVREELEAVVKESENDTAGIYPGSIFMNEAFTFNTLSEQVRRYRILHIATHAEFVPNIRDASYILSGTGEKLTIDQIGALDALFDHLHLVVLSACQTALGGESLDGTEIAGISSYFLGKNKAEAVLATLWRVDDTGTSLLMQRFYEILATGQVTKAEALRQAQLSLLYGEATLDDRLASLALEASEGSDRGLALSEPPKVAEATLDHPYYWAPFILIGNSL